jgi:hypothetical protein
LPAFNCNAPGEEPLRGTVVRPCAERFFIGSTLSPHPAPTQEINRIFTYRRQGGNHVGIESTINDALYDLGQTFNSIGRTFMGWPLYVQVLVVLAFIAVVFHILYGFRKKAVH